HLHKRFPLLCQVLVCQRRLFCVDLGVRVHPRALDVVGDQVVIVVNEGGHDVERHDRVGITDVIDHVHTEVDPHGTTVTAHPFLAVERCKHTANGLEDVVRMPVEVVGVPQHDHDVDV